MNPLLQFLQRYTYRKPETSTLQALSTYLSQIEKIASSQKDPTANAIVKSLRTTPIGKISYQLTILETHLTTEQQKEKQKQIKNGKINTPRPKPRPRTSAEQVIIYREAYPPKID
jgi:hypothetical protein